MRRDIRNKIKFMLKSINRSIVAMLMLVLTFSGCNDVVHVLLKPGLENFEHYFTSVWDECNCVVVWAFFGIAFLWNLNENWPFPALWPLLSFPNLLAYWVQHFTASSFRIWNSSTGIPSPPLALFVVMLLKAHLTSHSMMSVLHIPWCLG